MVPTKSHDTSNQDNDDGARHPEFAAAAAATTTSLSFCECPNKCKQFELLPSDQGLMITLHIPDHINHNDCHGDGDDGAATKTNSKSSPAANKSNSNNSSNCTCLKLHPQLDANLPQFHPNIYIPSSLLDYPDHLIKYGGGGSGVTVFGGYHPLLGNLVMKHGGHKDLIELVSLAKIERELGVRGHWKIDCLRKASQVDSSKRGEKKEDKMCHTEHYTEKQKRNNSADDYGEGEVEKMIHTDHSLGSVENGVHSEQHPAPKKTSFISRPATTMLAQLNNVKSQPMLAAMGTMAKRMSTVFQRASMDNLLTSMRAKSHEDGMGRPDSRTLSEEEFAELAEFERELQIQAIQFAMEDMKKRIPAFRMIYISPMHVRERKDELKNSTFFRMSAGRRTRSLGGWEDALKQDLEGTKIDKKRTTSSRCSSFGDISSDKSSNHSEANSDNGEGRKRIVRRYSSVMSKGRTLHLFGSPSTKSSSMKVQHDHVDMCFGGSYHRWRTNLDLDDANQEDINNQGSAAQETQHSCRSKADGSDGYASLMAFVDHLRQQQERNEWKITLAQQTIGQIDNNSQKMAMTASSLLAKGKLHGPLLHHLIDSEIQVIRNLQILTMEEESNVVNQVRAEYEDILSRQKNSGIKVSAAEVSSCANDFVGKAIHKNFHPVKGRFVMLRRFGIDLRCGRIHLQPKEVVPAKHLENLFYRAWEVAGLDDVEGCHEKVDQKDDDRRSLMEETFNMHYHEQGGDHSSPYPDHNHPIFDSGLDQWQSLLELSLSMKHPNATNRIWTCGLTDGGLHNQFLSEDQLWLFDLGEPNLEPIPAFLTKFLMSFFHTLGMEENEKGDWVVRFEQDDDSGKLRLTQQTLDILPKVMDAFNATMDRLIKELFDGEEQVRVLLLRYVVTQLISDAAFCIEKWRIKGGGDKERSNHQDFLQKWLWRALWDVYASEEIRRRYLTRMLLRRQMECRDLSSIDLGSLMD